MLTVDRLREPYLRAVRAWTEGPLRPWKRPAKAVLAAVLLGMLARWVDTGKVLAALRDADGWAIAAAAVLLLPNIGLQYGKWRSLVRWSHPAAPGGEILRSLLSGFAFALFTPARLGEFGGRALVMNEPRRGTLVALTAVDKFVSLAVTVAAGIAGLSVYLQRGAGASFLASVCAGAGVLVVGWVASARTARIPKNIGRALLRRSPVLQRAAARLAEGFPRVPRPVLLKQLALSAVFYATFCTQFILLLFAFGPVDIGAAAAGIACVMFAKSVIPPVTFGELGIREGAAVFFLGGLGIAAAAALNASFLLFCINILVPALAGGAVLAHRWLFARHALRLLPAVPPAAAPRTPPAEG